MSLGRARHGPWLPVAMAAAAVGSGACGDDGGEANGAAATPATATDRPTVLAAATGKIVIKAHADLQSVVDEGEVLSGSSLAGAPFCPGGKFSGGHGDTAMIDRTFECPGGSLRIGFIPGKESGRTVTGRWKVLGGTGAFKGMKGSGRMQTRFGPGSQPAEARETFTGSLVR